jgi:hypothetical protein
MVCQVEGVEYFKARDRLRGQLEEERGDHIVKTLLMNISEVEIEIGHRGQLVFGNDSDVIDNCGAE